MRGIEQIYRKRHLRVSAKYQAEVGKAFDRVVERFVKKFGNNPIIRNDENFQFSTNRKLNVELTEMMKRFNSELFEITRSGIGASWEQAEEMNDELVRFYFSGLAEFRKKQAVMMARNTEGVESFINRKHNARKLSDRIWEKSSRLRDELEASLLIGVSEGKSAHEIALQTQQYLKNPDALYRRVRDAKGDLRLSNAAKKLNPGKGVYRSSYQNALRLTATEINMAYRTADHDRWQTQDFILGFNVQLSHQHPRYDICDALQGEYPKSFLFVGWHPRCFCHVVPIRMNKDDFIRKLNGEEVKAERITQLPEGMRNWLKSNEKAVLGKKNKPFFVLDNFKVTKNGLKGKY